MKKALIANVAASMANAQPAPAVTIITLASTGPAIVQEFWVSEMSALACCKRPGETVCGMIPVEVGRKKRVAESVDDREGGDLPHLGGMGDKDGGGGRLRDQAKQVGADQQAPARQPIRDDAADEQERHQGERSRGEHRAEGENARAK